MWPLSMSSSLYLIGQGCEVSSNEMLSWTCSARYECCLFFHFYTFVLLFSSNSVSQRRSSRSGNVTHSLTDSEICSAYLNQLVRLITVTRCLPNGPKWFPNGPKWFPNGPKWFQNGPKWSQMIPKWFPNTLWMTLGTWVSFGLVAMITIGLFSLFNLYLGQ